MMAMLLRIFATVDLLLRARATARPVTRGRDSVDLVNGDAYRVNLLQDLVDVDLPRVVSPRSHAII